MVRTAAKRILRFQVETTMATGTVKFFNAQKVYGFIAQDAGGPDVFVHISAVERAGMSSLVEGQKVSFDVEADRRSGKSAATNLQAALSIHISGAGATSAPAFHFDPAQKSSVQSKNNNGERPCRESRV